METTRMGRPRSAGTVRRAHTPAEEILDAAAELFTRQGFGTTSTREIARASGITQPAIYHYFPTKLSILDRLLTTTADQACVVAEALSAQQVHPAARLYALGLFDTHQLLTSRWNIGMLAAIPESHHTDLEEYPAISRRLRAYYDDFSDQVLQSRASAQSDPTHAIRSRFAYYLTELPTQIRQDDQPWWRETSPLEIAGVVAELLLQALAVTDDLPRLRDSARLSLLAADPDGPWWTSESRDGD